MIEMIAYHRTVIEHRLAEALLAAFALSPSCLAQERATPSSPAHETATRRVVLFRAAGFPTVDAPEIDDSTLDESLRDFSVETCATTESLRARLTANDGGVLVLPYGSAFPLGAWDAIRHFLDTGGGLVVLGGAPFHQPVRLDASGRWVLGPRQPTFAHELLVGPAEPIKSAALRCTGPLDGCGLDPSLGAFPIATTTYALTVRFATRKDFEDEDGSAGPRDAVLRPLIHAVDAAGVARACPLLEIDRLRGAGAGGRWVFAPSDAKLGAPWIRAGVVRALQRASEIDARPISACIEPGETARIRVVVRRPSAGPDEMRPSVARVVVMSGGKVEFEGEAPFAGSIESRVAEVAIRTLEPLTPGLHRVVVRVPDVPFLPRETTTGFWVRDAKLLTSGPKLTVSRDWLRRDGHALPIVGTTYMASDVHRKFLFEPNPALWDRDFAAMEKAGVNFVRTGIWTAWSRAMLDVGAVDDGVVRALDAYVLTAAKHGIPVCFTFFAFLPPAFGGTNPYLDPRSLEGQKAFVTAIASRYRGVSWIHWDLINEPSYTPADALWENRPIGDAHERRAWEAWVRARHGDDPLVWRDLWRDASDDPLSLPLPKELSSARVRDGKRPRKARDFAEFSQDVVARWAATLRATIRAAAGDDSLVTLGEDEGGTDTRPAQPLFADSVDYTAIHTWWNDDDLLWDGVVTKTPEKASLIQETGLMRLEDKDGMPWRSPDDAAAILERKFALAFAARGAGAVEWAWNVNPYQPLDNESVIGLVRPDGTAKPERDVLPAFAAFFRAAAPLLDDFEPDPVVVVLPHGNLFAGRARAMNGVKQVVRTLADRFGVVPAALSELRLTAERLRGSKLVIVPSPETLEDGASRALLAASRAGTKVLVTGAIESDSYGRIGEALSALGIADRGRPVALREPTRWAADGGFATFDGKLSESLRRSECAPLAKLEGNVWHEPLPLDLARDTAPIRSLLAAALAAAGVETQPSDVPLTARVLRSPKAALVVCVNETSAAATRRVVVDGKSFDVPLPAGRSRLFVVDRTTHAIVASTPGEPIVAAK
ncbi:MAG: hypothetical protein HYR85_23670 [Planctomycetes bacterium]|nr:hypothetical protein [Planctomycetota bacterium]